MPDFLTIWNETSNRLRELVNTDIYDRWFAGIIPVAATDSSLTLGVSNDMFCEWLVANYKDLLVDTIQDITGKTYHIRFESGHHIESELTPEPELKTQKPTVARFSNSKSAVDQPKPGGRHTFDSFVIGDSNQFAHAAATAVAKAPGTAYNPLFIHSPVGLGKTHLLQAISNSVKTGKKPLRIEYITSEEFCNAYIDALRDNKLPEFRRRYRSMDILLLDDVQFFQGKDRLQEEFFHTFNELYNGHKQIVMTSDRPPQELGGLEKRLVSRFEWGLTTEIQPPDFETRVAILRKKQEGQAVKLGDDILTYIATNIRSSVRRLEGALMRLILFASLSGKTVTHAEAEGMLQNLVEPNVAATLTVHHIQKTVAEHFDTRLADMTGKSRVRNVAVPRQVAMYLARELTRESLPSIGEAFSRNHATVLHAMDAINKRLEADAGFRNDVHRIRQRLAV